MYLYLSFNSTPCWRIKKTFLGKYPVTDPKFEGKTSMALAGIKPPKIRIRYNKVFTALAQLRPHRNTLAHSYEHSDKKDEVQWFAIWWLISTLLPELREELRVATKDITEWQEASPRWTYVSHTGFNELQVVLLPRIFCRPRYSNADKEFCQRDIRLNSVNAQAMMFASQPDAHYSSLMTCLTKRQVKQNRVQIVDIKHTYLGINLKLSYSALPSFWE
jgi:hypothetical protein